MRYKKNKEAYNKNTILNKKSSDLLKLIFRKL